MSTRCHIALYRAGEEDLNKYQHLLYKHMDGYPRGMVPLLMPFVEFWDKARGLDDQDYFGARLMQYLGNQLDKLTIVFAKEMPMNDSKKEIKDTKRFSGTLSLGLCQGWHGDVEFVYAVYTDGTVKVFYKKPEEGKEMPENLHEMLSFHVSNYKKDKLYKSLVKESKTNAN